MNLSSLIDSELCISMLVNTSFSEPIIHGKHVLQQSTPKVHVNCGRVMGSRGSMKPKLVIAVQAPDGKNGMILHR